MSKKGTGKLILGAGIGAGLALLFAPKKGVELRADLKKRIGDLDKEKVKKIATKKAKQLKKKTEELVEYAKEKGTPVLEKAATEVKKQAANVCREVLAKLEDE